MKLGIVYDDRKTEAKTLALEMKTWLENRKYTINDGINDNIINDDADFIITFGGDGFILQIANEIASKNLNIPIIRVNLGHIGALASIEPEETFERLRQFLSGNYIIKRRTRIKAEIYSDWDSRTLAREIDALNEIVIERTQTRAISFVANGIKRSGDGIIIATQTGSTAYNHTAGGQVLVKNGMVLTVVSLGQPEGSFMVPTSFITKISDIVGEARLVADGNEVMNLSEDKVVLIKKSEKDTYFVEIGDSAKFGRADLLEELAAIEHEQWMMWSKNLMQTELLRGERLERWKELQIPYVELTEEQKDQDRIWARKALGILNGVEK